MEIARSPNLGEPIMPRNGNDHVCDELDQLREQIDRLAALNNPRIPPSFTGALTTLLTAAEYDDKELMRAGVQHALEEFQQVINEVIQARLAWPSATKETCQSVFSI